MNEDDDRTRLATNRAAVGADEQMTARPVADEPATAYRGNALPVGFIVSDFQIESVIGKGGFSIVYLARDRQLNRQNALKEYMPASMAARRPDLAITVHSDRLRDTFEAGLRSFVNEAQVLAQFDHPALVKVFRFWEERGTAYMAMPYYQGVTLKQVLRTEQAAPNEAWLRSIFEPLFDAIELLHVENYLHRDIAPDNIMILRNGAPLLLDFGAARHVISDMTQAPTAILKPGYAPIEQYAETLSTRQGPWTDVYAIAAVLYWAVTGHVPPPSVARMISDDLVPVTKAARKGYSDRFLAGIRAGLAIKPEDRPSSIAEFRNLLGYSSRPLILGAASDSNALVPLEELVMAPMPRERPVAPVQKILSFAVSKPTAAIAAPGAPRSSIWRYSGFALVLASVVAGVWWAVRPEATAPIAPSPVLHPSPPVKTSGSIAAPATPPAPETPASAAPAPSSAVVESAVTPEAPPPPKATPETVAAPVVTVPGPGRSPTAPNKPVAKAEVPKQTQAPHRRPAPSKPSIAPSVKPEPAVGKNQTCAELLLQEASLGFKDPELQHKLETMNCNLAR